jgi:hypothetical protein
MMNFTCGLPAGSDEPTNTEANADSPAGTHDPFAGTTYTPVPTANAAGAGIAGKNRVRRHKEKSEMGVYYCLGFMERYWGVMWGLVGGLLLVFAV